MTFHISSFAHFLSWSLRFVTLLNKRRWCQEQHTLTEYSNMETVNCWYFLFLGRLTTNDYINHTFFQSSQEESSLQAPYNFQNRFSVIYKLEEPCKSTAVVLGVRMMNGLSENSFCFSSSHSAPGCYRHPATVADQTRVHCVIENILARETASSEEHRFKRFVIWKLITSRLGFSESTTASIALCRVDVAQWKCVGSHLRSCICNDNEVALTCHMNI